MTDLSEQDKAAITQLWTEYGRALDRSDPEAIAALYAPDGDMTGIDGSHVEGPSAIASAYAAALEQKYADLSLSDVELGTPRSVGPGAALMNATWRVHGLEPEPFPVRATFVVRKEPEGWRYVAARFAAPRASVA